MSVTRMGDVQSRHMEVEPLVICRWNRFRYSDGSLPDKPCARMFESSNMPLQATKTERSWYFLWSLPVVRYCEFLHSVKRFMPVISKHKEIAWSPSQCQSRGCPKFTAFSCDNDRHSRALLAMGPERMQALRIKDCPQPWTARNESKRARIGS
jgi:hypothetical protein